MSNGIDRSQILNQLRVILTPQEYTACEGLSDAELNEKLRDALSNNGNMGVGDTFSFGATSGIIPTPPQPQRSIIPTFGPETTIPQLSTEQAQDVAMQNLWAINADLAAALRDKGAERADGTTSTVITTEARGLYYLDRSRSPQGLTRREYREGMKSDLRTMLIQNFPELENPNINLDERLDSLDTEALRMIQNGLITAESGRLDKNEDGCI